MKLNNLNNDAENKKKKGAGCGCGTIILILLMIGAIGRCGNKDDASEPDTSSKATIEQTTESETEKTEEEQTEPKTEKQTEPETKPAKESNITIVSHSLGKDYDGKDVLIIEYAYTNIEDKATSFSFACQDSVFQNGVECSSTVFDCDEIDTQQQLNDVQPGITYNLKVGYLLQDMTNATVVVTDLFGTETLLEQTIDLGGGEGTVIDTENLQETSLKITGHHMGKDYKDEDILIVDYEYYNGSDEPESFMVNFSAQAFQNGVECDDTVIGCDEIDSEKIMSEIQPGVTLNFSKGYHITDMSDVEIKVNGTLFDDTEYVSEIISLS